MEWFEDWFNSKYYHVLYKNRDKSEAIFFLKNIVNQLKLKDCKILDVACGKGRHSKHFNELGFEVTGIDLSQNSIEFAKKYSNDKLNFFVHDMRSVFKKDHFNLVTNLFTSFGYFEDTKDEQIAINSMSINLKKEGLLLIDFMNVKNVINSLVKFEIKEIDNVKFTIERKYDGNHIIKKIKIEDKEEVLNFQEKVRALTLNDFSKLLDKVNMKIIDLFGDYSLNNYNANNSERLIIVSKK